ncbi:mitochondrial import inner membrane translocase subunit Tim10B [Sitophilus oryzae]|uniref:Mitochondrial import inner membrane translocase subunit n=1 Tax=Sitophilus oryzae TaxID=7048 RepID=A0A6J2XIE6_SITOR|nr:mitochondrial import inner membrane translocase subunit Tim10B [Sitophilus oryzae]
MDPVVCKLKTFKDFLELYNKMTEMCFKRCVDNMYTRKLDQDEIACVDDCSQKFIYFNNKLMQNFIQAQTEKANLRAKEAEEQQKLAEAEQKQNQQKEVLDKEMAEPVGNREITVSSS